MTKKEINTLYYSKKLNKQFLKLKAMFYFSVSVGINLAPS